MITRLSIFVLLFSVVQVGRIHAQSAPGCSQTKAEFEVKTEKDSHAAKPEPGKALVYFLQDDLHFDSRPRPTTLFGIDGNWVGATHGNSYFFVYVEPGEHHLCSEWQMDVILNYPQKRTTAALHFTAESGKTYYFRAKDIAIKELVGAELEAMDSDEAQLVMGSFEYSSSHPKK
jgi:hypothetical protein